MTIYQTVTLVRSGPHVPWGFRLANDSIRPEIGRINPNSISARFLSPGQALIEVNSENIESNTNTEIVNLIKQAGNVLHLKVEKLNPSIESSSYNNVTNYSHVGFYNDFPYERSVQPVTYDDSYLNQPPKPLVSENFLPAPPQCKPATCVLIPGYQMPDTRIRRASSAVQPSYATNRHIVFGSENYTPPTINRNRNSFHSGYESDSYYSCPAPPSKIIQAPNKAALLTRSQRNSIRNQNINPSNERPNKITVLINRSSQVNSQSNMTNNQSINSQPIRSFNESQHSRNISYNLGSSDRIMTSDNSQLRDLSFTFPRNRSSAAIYQPGTTITPQVKNKRSVSFSIQREPRNEYSELGNSSHKNGNQNYGMNSVLNEFQNLILKKKQEREDKRRMRGNIRHESIQEEDPQIYLDTNNGYALNSRFPESYVPSRSFLNLQKSLNDSDRKLGNATSPIPVPVSYARDTEAGSTDF